MAEEKFPWQGSHDMVAGTKNLADVTATTSAGSRKKEKSARVIKGQNKIGEYLRNLPKNNLPFNCPDLRRLDEPLRTFWDCGGQNDYEPGDLLCVKSGDSELESALHAHYCAPVSNLLNCPRVLEDGKILESSCGYGRQVKFIITEID